MTRTPHNLNGKLVDTMIGVASGDIQKQAYAEMVGLDPTKIGGRLNQDFATAIKELQADRKRLQEQVSALQAKESDTQDKERDLQDAENRAQSMATEVQRLQRLLQESSNAFQEKERELQSTLALLQVSENRVKLWEGKPKFMQLVGGNPAGAFLAFLLASFEMVGVFTMLYPKGLILAVPASVAIGFALLHFTAAGNKLGRVFSVLFALAIGVFFFKPWQLAGIHQDYIFAVLPPILQAIITSKQSK